MSKPRVIAFYLPQFHPTPDNDKWWGKGFTEWTNVGKAKPLFRGHYQPKVPADLGYYDLRLPEIREAQAELAKEAGIYGFCYYHYWFGNGKEELELPFNEVLRIGKPDFPFMLCWANESWHRKFWSKDGKGSSKEILISQTYPGEQDIIDHFYRLLPAFKDHRYIRIDGKPAFMIYTPQELPDPSKFIAKWNEMAITEGLNGIFFIGQERLGKEQNLKNGFCNGFDAMNTVNLSSLWINKNKVEQLLRKSVSFITNTPRCVNYSTAYNKLCGEVERQEKVYPTLIPNWDHTPRSGKRGTVLTHVTQEAWHNHISNVLEAVRHKSEEHQIIFLKSWNEWGEGNYIEPDLKYGKMFINELRSTLQ